MWRKQQRWSKFKKLRFIGSNLFSTNSKNWFLVGMASSWKNGKLTHVSRMLRGPVPSRHCPWPASCSCLSPPNESSMEFPLWMDGPTAAATKRCRHRHGGGSGAELFSCCAPNNDDDRGSRGIAAAGDEPASQRTARPDGPNATGATTTAVEQCSSNGRMMNSFIGGLLKKETGCSNAPSSTASCSSTTSSVLLMPKCEIGAAGGDPSLSLVKHLRLRRPAAVVLFHSVRHALPTVVDGIRRWHRRLAAPGHHRLLWWTTTPTTAAADDANDDGASAAAERHHGHRERHHRRISVVTKNCIASTTSCAIASKMKKGRQKKSPYEVNLLKRSK